MNNNRSPKIIYKFKIIAKLKLLSPLRIGTGENDGITDILILKTKQGDPFIPGTALAGVLRANLAQLNPQAADLIFGKTSNTKTDLDNSQSSLIISDTILNNWQIIKRDGIKIDPRTGISTIGGKFDFEVVERGAHGELKIIVSLREWQLEKHSLATYQELFRNLAGSLAAGIRIGGITTKGFGQIIAENVILHTYDLTKFTDVKAWLYQQPANTEIITATDKQINQKNFTLLAKFALQSSLIIRSDDLSDFASTTNIPDAIQLKSSEDFVIPGSSLKGVLRNQSIRILSILNKDLSHLNNLMGFSENNTQKQKSRLLVSEIYIKKASGKIAGATPQEHTRNKIDRFTNATIDAALFTNQPIVQNSPKVPIVDLKLEVINCQPWEAGLMLLLLKDLWTGRLAIGGEKGIGRGRLIGNSAQITYQGQEYLLQNLNGKISVSNNATHLEEFVQAINKLEKAGESICK